MKSSRTLPDRLTVTEKRSPRKSRSQDRPRQPPLPLPPISKREKLDSVLECAICKSRYEKPKTLTCQHTFCLGCLDSIIENQSDISASKERLKCPVCRSEQKIPKGGVSKLPTNVTIDALLDLHDFPFEDEKSEDLTQCTQCGCRGKLYVCMLHCNKLLCMNCYNSHAKHSRESTRKLVSTLKSDLNRLQLLKIDWESKRQNLLASHKQVKMDTDDFFDHAINQLKKLKLEVQSRSDKLVLPYVQGIEGLVHHIDDQMQELESMTSELEDYVMQKGQFDQWRLLRTRYEAQMKHSECQNIGKNAHAYLDVDSRYKDRLVTKVWYKYSNEEFDELLRDQKFNKISFTSKQFFADENEANSQKESNF